MLRKFVDASIVRNFCSSYTTVFTSMETQAKRTTRSAAKRKLCTSGGNPDVLTPEKKSTKPNIKMENIEVASNYVRRCVGIKESLGNKLDSLKKDEKTSQTLNERGKGNIPIKIGQESSPCKKGKTGRGASTKETKVTEGEQNTDTPNDVEGIKAGDQKKSLPPKEAAKPQEVIKKGDVAVKESKSIKERLGELKGDSKTVKAKKEKSEKDPKERAPKPELEIPEIVIPTKLKKIARVDGPSPWNGSVSYTNKVYLGAHISAAGGLEKAIPNAKAIGGTCFALFIKNQRQWASKPLEKETVEKFREACIHESIAPHLILPHGSYLMNCGSNDIDILKKSRATLLEEVRRCERLGILYYNIHPGSSCGKNSKEECIQNISDSINWVHHETLGSKVAVVLENMCRQGNTVGGDFAELANIISLVADQSRVGVCLDTCHAFAAGYDLASEKGFESFLEEFERHVGFRYLVAVHLNDSEGPLGCHRDRHACIGKGHIGIEGFRRIINCPRFRDIPIVLETPYISEEAYANEIKLLKSLAKGDTVCA